MRRIAIVIPMMILSSCAPQDPIHTASGQPEMTFSSVDAQCVRSAFLNRFVDRGYAVKTASDTQIVAGKPSDNFVANVFLSTDLGGAPEDRITALFISNGNGGMRVVTSEQLVSNAGTGFERASLVAQTQEVQRRFDAEAAAIQAQCGH